MSVLYLVRHGQASFGAENYDALSSLGEKQAQLLGQQLSKLCTVPPRVITGGMQRHSQTMQAANLHCDFDEITEDKGWNEYDHQGILAAYDERFATPDDIKSFLATQSNGKAAFAQAFAGAIKQWQAHSGDGYDESWAQFKTRVEGALSGALDALSCGRDIVVFSSGGPISWCLVNLLKSPASQWLPMNWTLVNAGYHKIIKSSFGTFASSINEHSYLQIADPTLITYK